MPRTYAEIRDLALQTLIDAGIDPGGVANQVFAVAELDAFIPDAVTEVSRYRPREIKDTSLTATAATWDVTLSSDVLRNLIRVVALEFDPQSGYDPTFYRHNFTRFGSTIRLHLDSAPAGGEAIHLYLHKRHLLVNVGTTDLAGAVKTTTAAGLSTLPLKSLGTGTINEDTTLTISGDSTVYSLTSNATIAAAEATVSITPVLAAQATLDAVVTLAAPTSTIDDILLEGPLADLIAARAAINKARTYIGSVTVGAGRSPQEMIGWGQAKLSDTIRQLRAMQKRTTTVEYAR
jgi:hypothetical protein